MREDRSFTPEPPFAISSWELAAPQEHGDCYVVKTIVRGADAEGGDKEMTMPFVLVAEEDAWRIDMARSMGMQMTGDPHAGMGGIESALEGVAKTMADGLGQAMAGIADAMSSAFSNAEAESYQQQRAAFLADELSQIQASVIERLGVPIELRVDLESFDKDAVVVARISGFLSSNLVAAFAMIRDEARTWLASGLERIAVRAAVNASELGFRKREGVLEIVLPASGDADRFSMTTVACLLELDSEPELQPRVAWAMQRLGAWQERWKESFGFTLTFVADWQSFSRSWEALVNAWALHLLAEHGIDPLGDAVGALLASEPRWVEIAKERLQLVRIECSHEPEDRFVDLVGGDLCYRLYVAETHQDYWPVEELKQRLATALGNS